MNRLLDSTSALELSPIDVTQIVAGQPVVGSRSLTTIGEIEIGVWEISDGVSTDTEVDEVFVVLSGTATVEFHDGEVLHLAPGSVVRLFSGDRTTWTVHEKLRKVYIA